LQAVFFHYSSLSGRDTINNIDRTDETCPLALSLRREKVLDNNSEKAGTRKRSLPWGIALDAAGTLYIADSWNARIRKVTAESQIITDIAPQDAILTTAGHQPGGFTVRPEDIKNHDTS
jgi:sugar lactone lactonase YvrE